MKKVSATFIILLAFATVANALPGAGWYLMSDIIVRHIPAHKQNGSAWDPMGGAPDVFVSVWVVYGGAEEEHQGSTSVKDNAGSSAIWSRSQEFFVGRGESDDNDIELLIKVWDEDMSRHDFIDSGKISFADLNTGEIEIELSFGTTISFELEGPYDN